MPSSAWKKDVCRSEEHTSELQSLTNIVCRLLLEKKSSRDAPYERGACGARAHRGPVRAPRSPSNQQGRARTHRATPRPAIFFFKDGAPPEIAPLAQRGPLPI